MVLEPSGQYWYAQDHALGLAGVNSNAWSQSTLPLPPAVALGNVAAVAMPPSGSQVWVADSVAMCLRCYNTSGVWDPQEYKPPTGTRMGLPRGIAFTPDGVMFVVDGLQLWRFTGYVGGVLTGTAVTLPAALQGHIAGLTCRRSTDTLFLSGYSDFPYQDHLWKMQLTPPSGLGTTFQPIL